METNTNYLTWWKATSKFKGFWNTQESENESFQCIDFERDIQEFKILDEPNLLQVADLTVCKH